MANGTVDTDQVVALVIDDGVEHDCGLAGLPIADDQLTLATTDRDHTVDGLESSSHGLAHRLASDNAGRQALQRDKFIGSDWTLIVNWLAERVDHATD